MQASLEGQSVMMLATLHLQRQNLLRELSQVHQQIGESKEQLARVEDQLAALADDTREAA